MTTERDSFERAFKDEMLTKVASQTGLQKFTDADREVVERGCDEILEKMAVEQGNFWEKLDDKPSRASQFFSTMSDGAGKALGGAAASATAGATLYGGSKLINYIQGQRNQHAFMDAVNRAVRQNQILQREYESEAGKEKIMSFAQTINRFAPSVATDSNLLASVLANAVQYDGIDTQTLQHLTDLEKRHGEVNKPDIRNFR